MTQDVCSSTYNRYTFRSSELTLAIFESEKTRGCIELFSRRFSGIRFNSCKVEQKPRKTNQCVVNDLFLVVEALRHVSESFQFRNMGSVNGPQITHILGIPGLDGKTSAVAGLLNYSRPISENTSIAQQKMASANLTPIFDMDLLLKELVTSICMC